MAPVNPADKKNNVLNIWGNEKTMNLNNMILTNILSSHYFKVNLYQLKTYHEVIDEIYYHVNHLEPWEKGSRKTSGQTGMCGGVRGVGAGGIVSTAFCILYKLFTLKLTRKQVVGLLTHCDSPYIRALGFMYIRYTQHPGDLWDWFEIYLDDDEEVDVKAGGGQVMTIGEMLRHFLSKLEWFSTLFPRIPVPIQKDIEKKLSTCKPPPKAQGAAAAAVQADEDPTGVAGAMMGDYGEEGEEMIPDEEGEGDVSVVAETNASRDQDGANRRLASKERSTRDRADFGDDIVRERDRQRRDRTPPQQRSGHHHHRRGRNDYKDRSSRNSSRARSRSRSHDRRYHHSASEKYDRHIERGSHGSRSHSSEGRSRSRKHKSSSHR